MIPRPLPMRASSASETFPPSHSGCSLATLWYAELAAFTRSSSRRGARPASIRSRPVLECEHEMLDRLLLTALEHRQVEAGQDEVLVDELQHRHLMPCRRIHGDIAGTDCRMRVPD